jgi:pantothenate kinase-related protein Tda10
MTSEDRELIEAWRAVANAKLAEYRRQCWRLALLVRDEAFAGADFRPLHSEVA